ncbi:MAG: alpha/beta hydrolase, partial [Flavobacteriia bacterium]|nr:alpha/beta hydrolase [Flavobacteriia bacterium]
MQRITNGIYKGTDGRESLYDLFQPEDWQGDLILFVHGFMGFKDWGAWNLVATYFEQQGFAFA